MCFSTMTTRSTPSFWKQAKASSGYSRKPSREEVSHGDIVGGRWISNFGLIANRAITSSTITAFASGTSMVRPVEVVTMRLPSTSSRSRGSSCWACAESSSQGRFGGYPSGRIGLEWVFVAETETISFSGHLSAVSLPPNTQPVSTHSVLFSHSASGTGVWP